MLDATRLPLIVLGPGQAELDNEVLVACAEEGAGEKLVLGPCEDKNYRTIVAAAMANGHLVTAKTPMDVNLSKQLNILIHDMGMPMERIITDPTTGALGYGIEYGYSVMERLRLAALQGDGMTQQPMLVTPGEEAWRTKEARAAEGVPAAWGDWASACGQLGDHDRGRAGRIGRRYRGAAASRDGAADQADDRRAGSVASRRR